MKSRLLNVAIGLVAGICGGFAMRPSTSDPAEPVQQAQTLDHQTTRVIVPPGWKANRVEAGPRLSDLSTAATEVEPPSPRERDRAHDYQQELDAQVARVADHRREDLDASWSTASVDQIRANAAALGLVPDAIDCRSKTCVATLRFATPMAGLEFLGSPNAGQLQRGFSGLISTPTPPTTDGDYDLTVVLRR